MKFARILAGNLRRLKSVKEGYWKVLQANRPDVGDEHGIDQIRRLHVQILLQFGPFANYSTGGSFRGSSLVTELSSGNAEAVIIVEYIKNKSVSGQFSTEAAKEKSYFQVSNSSCN